MTITTNSAFVLINVISGITLYGPQKPEERTSIVSFSLQNQDPKIIVQRLENQNLILAVREIFDKKIIRASPHLFNSESQMLKVIEEIGWVLSPPGKRVISLQKAQKI